MCFYLLLTMVGSQVDETDWENMTHKELHDKFPQMMTEQVQDVLNNFEEAMDKIIGFEKKFWCGSSYDHPHVHSSIRLWT